MPVHGASYVVNGSGFGSKTGDAQIWDDCTGSDPSTLWGAVKPDGAGSISAGANIDYRTITRSVAMPHSRISQYLCAAHDPRTDANNGYNVYVSVDFSKPAFPFYSYWHWYARVDPNWVFDAGTENHKIYGYSTGNGSIYNLPNNWYLEFQGAGNWESSSSVAQWHTNDDATGTGLSLGGSYSVYSAAAQTNPVGAWVKRELCIKWQSDTTGFLKGWADNVVLYDETGKTDGYSVEGDLRCEGIEGYSGNGDTANWRYMADIGYMRGAHIGRMVLTNHATYASATIVEYQPYTAWAATSVTITVNGGALPDGTVHLHYRDEVNGNQYLGTITLGAAASTATRSVIFLN